MIVCVKARIHGFAGVFQLSTWSCGSFACIVEVTNESRRRDRDRKESLHHGPFLRYVL